MKDKAMRNKILEFLKCLQKYENSNTLRELVFKLEEQENFDNVQQLVFELSTFMNFVSSYGIYSLSYNYYADGFKRWEPFKRHESSQLGYIDTKEHAEFICDILNKLKIEWGADVNLVFEKFKKEVKKIQGE